MSVPINQVAQYAMDAYYRDYKGNSDFFDLDDFIFHCGATAADYYRQEWAAKYAELKAEKSESLVSFGEEMLIEATLQAKPINGGFCADIDFNYLTFTYDHQSGGIQNVFSRGMELERSSVGQKWQLNSLPVTSRIFWYVMGKKIFLFTNGAQNVVELQVLYIPGIGPKMELPDGVVKYVIDTTVSIMRQIEQGKIIKETNDGNNNAVMESEINKAALR
jgi:hypothetical protein